MINGVSLKVCGITNRADAEFAAKAGADYLGFIFHAASPRAISLADYARLGGGFSSARRVAVTVEPTIAELKALVQGGFDFFQVHFRHDFSASAVNDWSVGVGKEKLWLAPKLPPGVDVPPSVLPLAQVFLLDTFDAEKFGGTGRTGDWPKFARHQARFPEKKWILSGGLNPENIAEAVRASGAKFVDVNSGVESTPGKKDHAKIVAVAQSLAAL
ncbi:MAG: phosphoribosylanthranilate isomerase [Verrucomicrobia bacterium]|nr:phosphoribosylanthranilate isomerase [Verrucomicrobiota bacterium]